MTTYNAPSIGRTLEVNETIARKVLTVVDAGLVTGLGENKPGEMCVEAAVCFAYGLPHGDNPPCVGASVRSFKIRLNDSNWSSDAARAKGMRKLALAQLGSDAIDQKAFTSILAEQTIRQIVPIALRSAARRIPKHAERLEVAAIRCEKEGSAEAAMAARGAANDAAAYAYAAAAADASASAAAYASSSAAAAAYAYAAAAADASASAAAAADASASAAEYASSSASAAAAAYAAAAAERDRVLTVSAEIGVQALIELKSPGCEFLYLTEKST